MVSPAKTQTVIVCGGRTYADGVLVERVLTCLPSGSIVVHGAARGADTLADVAARRLGLAVHVYPALWREEEGRSAGPRRNQRMLVAEKPTLVIAFPGGSGTEDMVTRATRAGVRVIRVQGDVPDELMEVIRG